MSVTDEKISTKHLGAFPRATRRLLLEVTAIPGVRHRVLDGSHVLLFVDSSSEAKHGHTLKVSRSRKPEDTEFFVRRLLEENGIQAE